MLSASDSFQIDLVGQSVWSKLIDSAVSEAPRQWSSDGLSQLTQELLLAFHDRHIGLTPQLAVGLAALISVRNAQQQIGMPWRAPIMRLRRTLHHSVGAPAVGALERQGGFPLREAPTYTLLRFAMPLVERACRQVGQALLFCDDDLSDGVDASAYEHYQQQVHEAFITLAESDLSALADGEPPDDDAPFWAEVVLTLASRALGPEAGSGAPPLAAVDPSDMAWLLRLRPEPAPPLQSTAPPRVMLTPLKRQKSRRLQEGGISGYRLSQRVEDIDEIVHSELLYPDVVFYDRILNSGYLVVERPPRHQKRRDCLTVGMLPPTLYDHQSAGFLKACWFDCVWRFGTFLRSQHMMRSEIRWIEGDGMERARHASYLLADLPGAGGDPNPSEAERWMFLRSLRWLPAFLNRRDRPIALRLAPERHTGGDLEEALPAEAVWLRAAWETQRENLRIDPDGPAPTRPRSWSEVVAEFAHTQLMLFLPGTVLSRASDPRARAVRIHRRLLSQFRFAREAGLYLSLTFVPELPLIGDQWLFVTADGVRALDGATGTPETIAGELERLWIERMMKDVCRG